VYSVILVNDNWLPGNTRKVDTRPFVADQSAISPFLLESVGFWRFPQIIGRWNRKQTKSSVREHECWCEAAVGQCLSTKTWVSASFLLRNPTKLSWSRKHNRARLTNQATWQWEWVALYRKSGPGPICSKLRVQGQRSKRHQVSHCSQHTGTLDTMIWTIGRNLKRRERQRTHKPKATVFAFQNGLS